MAPRGLSAEEKRVRLLEIFHETKDFFQLKELEKLGPKMKGIVSQSVKEVLQSLVDDGLVNMDKIGSSNFFWSFPSQRGALMQNRLDAAKASRDSSKANLDELRVAMREEKSSRPETAKRTVDLKELENLRTEADNLEKELAQYGACDPVKVEEKRRAVMLAREAAIRWTDNYCILMSYFTRQYGASTEDVRSFLGVSEDYEDL